MSDLKDRYLKLQEKAISASSVDVGRGTIFLFEKYCRRCGQGMIKPNQWDRRALKKLWKKSFCKPECLGLGSRLFSTFPQTVKPQVPSHKKEHIVEELAFLSIQVEREERKMSPVLRLINYANKNFRLLSEKLRYLEIETGKVWGASKYFYWVAKSYE